jgi:ubiquitin carboxyl-terminal hydrolase 14
MENVLKLSCHIDNNNNPVNHLNEGLKVSLDGDIEKFSEIGNKNCVYHKSAKINKLVKELKDNLIYIAILFNYSVCEVLLEEGKQCVRN